MGCDIHMVVERRVGDEWVAWSIPAPHSRLYVKEGELDFSVPVALGRNYTRFAKLAGVRGEGPEPRGIPEDASQSSRALIAHWGSDGHSHSWVGLDEAARIFLGTEYREFAPDSYPAKYPGSHYFNVDELDDHADEYRLVFWFDN